MKLGIASLLLAGLALFGGFSASKEPLTTATLKVSGNCEMCKARIEAAALSVKGVKKASWSPKDDVLTLQYTDKMPGIQQVHQRVAQAGHDTEAQRAPDAAYTQLPGCCQYRR